jgi:protein-S-isoprenylcysteine O-methyltransferase Ste14
MWLSRRSLLRPSSHGFARFFAFEAILVLLVFNLPSWFDRPLATRQVLSWILLAASLVELIGGVWMFHLHGGERTSRTDPTLYLWESTSRLVTSGIFRYIRHPMYGSLLLLSWGAMLKSVSLMSILLAVTASVALYFTATSEERENVQTFGEEYRKYMKRTRRFIPFVF